jgi:hypothetical protein
MHHFAFFADSFPGLPGHFGGPGFSSGPPAIFMVFFVVIFVLVVGSILFRLFRGVSEWSENNQEPVLTVPARVVTKRTALSVYTTDNAGTNTYSRNSSTSYFATFEFGSGDRKEFKLSASQYGLLAEQDVGQLTFQGTRYQGFAREETAPAAGATPAAEPGPTAGAAGFCPYCGVPVRTGFKFCPQCGKPQPEKSTQA